MPRVAFGPSRLDRDLDFWRSPGEQKAADTLRTGPARRGVQPGEPRGAAHEPWRKRIKCANVLQPRLRFFEQLEALVIEISLGSVASPVTLLPGRARLSISPRPTGSSQQSWDWNSSNSVADMTIGIVLVA